MTDQGAVSFSEADRTPPFAELGMEPKAFIGGIWRDAADGRRLAVKDPSTGQIVEQISLCGAAEAKLAVEAAQNALPDWKRRSPLQRSQILHRIADLIAQKREPLARLAVLEQGMPLEANRGAVDYAATFFRWFAEEARRIYGRTIAHPDPARRLRVEYVPLGVAGIITPWNGPIGSPAKKVAAALAAGCSIVLKPSELTPLSALALAGLAEQAGLPPGVLNVVCGDAPEIGRALLEHDAVRVISFTGSLRTGRHLYTEAAKSIKKVALELGGNAPFIIFEDAKLERAIDDLIGLKVAIAGQLCVTANRVFVHESVFEHVAAELARRYGAIRVGDGFDPNAQMGPLITHDAAQRISQLIEAGVATGGRILCGGIRPSAETSFFPPTVITHPPGNSRLVDEEIFGPVIVLIPFKDEQEVIAAANATPYRLAAFAYTESLGRAERVCSGLDFGVVGLNDPRPVTCEAPFGGMAQSGLGREGGSEGLLDFMDCKLIGQRFEL